MVDDPKAFIIGEIIDSHGAGVYQLVVWGAIDGTTAMIANYPVFWEVDAPSGYD